MAQSFVCRSLCQNPHDGKKKLAGGTPTKKSNCRNSAPTTSRTSTSAVPPVVAPLAAFGSADSFVVRYLKDDLQRIFRTVLNSRPLAPVLAPTATPHYKGPRERPLKAWFPDIYWDKTHLECYNFLQKCEDHFATAGATGSNRVLFAATFLKDTALFRWQQYQRKVEDQTNTPISWEGFKAFLRQSLGESEAFVDTIWSTIRKDSQHQFEEVMDWAAHLEHLQTVLQEFDANAVISEPVLIRLFRNGLRPSIRAQAKQKGHWKDTWDQAIKKAITAWARAALNLSLCVHEIDARYLRGHRSTSKTTKDHTWDQVSLFFRPQEARAMPPHCPEPTKIERPCRDHQKSRRNRNCRNCGPCSSRPQGSTTATGFNTTKTPAWNNRGRNQPARREDRFLSRNTCYNYNRKGHFANQCPKTCKPKN